jgi:Pvc16 N-terminal domain
VPDSGVIADVSLTLQTVLTDAFSTLLPAPPPVAEVHDLQGTISTTPARMTIFLFEVIEDFSLRNRPQVRQVTPPNLTMQKPPMALVLKFLLTPWSGDRITDHRMLGRALQVLYDDAILSGPQLQGGLVGSGEALKVTLAPLTLEERTRVWHAVQRPYRLSLNYEVRVINLDAVRQETRVPVRTRVLDAAVPQESSV